MVVKPTNSTNQAKIVTIMFRLLRLCLVLFEDSDSNFLRSFKELLCCLKRKDTERVKTLKQLLNYMISNSKISSHFSHSYLPIHIR